MKFGVELYHEIGFLFMRQRPMQPGDFEYESFTVLEQRGHRVERIDSKQLRERFPAWNSERYPDGFLDLEAGYAESGRAVADINPVGEIARCGIARKCKVPRIWMKRAIG